MNEITMATEFASALTSPARPQIVMSTLLNSWLAPRVVAKDMESIACSAKMNLLANMLNAILLTAAVALDLSLVELAGWFGAYCSILLLLYRRRLLRRRWGLARGENNRHRELVTTSTLLGMPLAWMALCHIGWVASPAEVAIFIVCAGMSAGAAIALARVPKAVAAYLIVVLGSVITKCAWIGTLAYLAIGGFTCVYAACLVGAAALFATTQRQLEMNSELLSSLLENVPQGVCLYNADQKIVLQNDMFGELYGLSRDQLPNGTTLQRVLELRIANGQFAEDGAESYLAERQHGLQNAYNKVHRLKDGRYIAVGHRPLENGGWVTSHEDITSLKRAEAQVVHLAHHDPLTDLANRTLLGDRLRMALAQCDRGHSVELLLLDLDLFKAVNDTYGHAVGDELLKSVSTRLRACVRAGDTVARVGGDEFAIVLVNCSASKGARVISGRIIDTLTEPFDIQEFQIRIGVSIGIASAVRAECNGDALLKAADAAMYQAKKSGGNKACMAAANKQSLVGHAFA